MQDRKSVYGEGVTLIAACCLYYYNIQLFLFLSIRKIQQIFSKNEEKVFLAHIHMHVLHNKFTGSMWIHSPSAPIRPSLSSSAAHRKALVSVSVRTRAPGENLWRKNLADTEPQTNKNKSQRHPLVTTGYSSDGKGLMRNSKRDHFSILMQVYQVRCNCNRFCCWAQMEIKVSFGGYIWRILTVSQMFVRAVFCILHFHLLCVSCEHKVIFIGQTSNTVEKHLQQHNEN